MSERYLVKAGLEKTLAIARFFLVTLIVLAVGTAGIGHVAAYEGGSTAVAMDSPDAGPVDNHSDHSTERGPTSDTSDAGDCSDTDPCVGCAIHCSAIAAMDGSSMTMTFRLGRLPVTLSEQLLASDAANLERPPRAI